MSFLSAAQRFDASRQPVPAMWAYEIALAEEGATLEAHCNLVALYFAACDPGYFSEHKLDKALVDLAYPRARRVLELAREKFGDHPEIRYWELLLAEVVLGLQADLDAYRQLAHLGGSWLPHLRLFLASGRREYENEVKTLFRETVPDTERGRYILSLAKTYL